MALEDAKAEAPSADHSLLVAKAVAAARMKAVVDEVVEHAKEALHCMDELMAVCEEVKVEARVRLMSFMPPKEDIMEADGSDEEEDEVPRSSDPKENLALAERAREAADEALARSHRDMGASTEAAKAACEEWDKADNFLGAALDELAALGVSEEELEEKTNKGKGEQELLDRLKFYREAHNKALAAKEAADKRRREIVRRLRADEQAAIRAIKTENFAAAARLSAAEVTIQEWNMAMEEAEAKSKAASRALKEAEAEATEAAAAVEASRAEENGAQINNIPRIFEPIALYKFPQDAFSTCIDLSALFWQRSHTSRHRSLPPSIHPFHPSILLPLPLIHSLPLLPPSLSS